MTVWNVKKKLNLCISTISISILCCRDSSSTLFRFAGEKYNNNTRAEGLQEWKTIERQGIICPPGRPSRFLAALAAQCDIVHRGRAGAGHRFVPSLYQFDSQLVAFPADKRVPHATRPI